MMLNTKIDLFAPPHPRPHMCQPHATGFLVYINSKTYEYKFATIKEVNKTTKDIRSLGAATVVSWFGEN